MRFISFCMVLLILIFVGHCIYYRNQADRLLNRALEDVIRQPKVAYATLRPALDASDLVTLGKISDARERFRKKLVETGLLHLQNKPPQREDFIFARDVADTLDQMKEHYGADELKTARNQILSALRDAMPEVRDHGVLSAWEMLQSTLSQINVSGGIPPEVIRDYPAWAAQLDSVTTRPLGLREAYLDAGVALRGALAQIGVVSAKNARIAPVPENLRDGQLIAAEQGFNDVAGAVSQFMRKFNETQTPAELRGIEAVSVFDLAAIKLAHLQDRSPLLARNADGYLASLYIHGNEQAPTAGEMYQSFLNATEQAFTEAQKDFGFTALLDPDMRRAYQALCSEGDAAVLKTRGQADSAYGLKAQTLASSIHDPEALAVIQEMRATPHAKIIVALPLPKQ